MENNDDMDENIHFTEEKESGDHALNLKFTIGYSSNMIGAIHNLTLGDKREIFFPSAHTGVIYNYDTHEQKLLQGHCNKITACIAVHDQKENKRWIVTADSGKDSMIVVWDADTATPNRTIFIKKSDEIVSLDMSKDCNYIATLSNELDEKRNITSQVITVWKWKIQSQDFIFNAIFIDKEGEIFNLLRFNPNFYGDEIEVLINGPHKILFWLIHPTNPQACRCYFPPKKKAGEDKKDKDKKEKEKDKEKENEKEKEKDKEKDKEKEQSKENNEKANKDKSSSIKEKEQLCFTQSTFINGETMVITATTTGKVIVWDACEALCLEDEVATDRRKIKTVQLLKYKTNEVSDKDGKLIVIGSGDGAIKFYDYNFIILRWFENVCWLVTSISFDLGLSKGKDDLFGMEANSKLEEESKDPKDTANKFSCIPFITSDISGVIKRISDKKTPMIYVSDQNIEYLEIYRGMESNIKSIAVHPHKQIIALGTDGNSIFKKKKERLLKDTILREKKFEFRSYIQLFYYPDYMKVIMEENEIREKENLKRKQEKEEETKKNDKDTKKNEKFEPQKRADPYKIYTEHCPTVLEFSNDGNYLMVGLDKGDVLIFSPENLNENRGKIDVVEITENERPAILDIIFANDNKHLAVSDRAGRIGLFRNENPNPENFVPEKCDWLRLVKHHFLSTLIISFCFSEKSNKLYVICKDKFLYEFEVLSNYEKDFPTPRKVKIEYDSNMTSIVWYPLAPGRDRNLLITNDEYKMRLVMTSDLIVKQTSLGPTYGGPIKKLRVIPSSDKEKTLLAFMTDHKIFGLIILPLDGNPHRIMGVIGHPGNMQDIRVAKSGEFIFTTGGTDLTINGWKYNATPLVEAVTNGGKGNDAFLSLLEDGREGLMYQEMVNFFYYAQIKSKDENTTKVKLFFTHKQQRTLGESVPTKLVSGLMAAMGYYPSIQELENIKNEVKYSKFSETEKTTDNITFDMFVKLYINHRPYRDIEFDKFKKSFENIRKFLDSDSKKGTIKRDKFFELLKENGDCMNEEEIAECLDALTEDRNVKSLREDLDANYLYEEILGFKSLDKEDEV